MQRRESEASSAEQASEWISEWLTTNLPNLRGSESQCILPIVRPKRISGAAITTDSETYAHTRTYTHTNALTHTHERAAEINELAEPQRRGIAPYIRTHTRTHAHAHTQSHTLMHIYTHARMHTLAHTLKYIYKHAHKRTAGINEKGEPGASVAVYPALLLRALLTILC